MGSTYATVLRGMSILNLDRRKRIVLRGFHQCNEAQLRATYGEAAALVADRLKQHIRRTTGHLPQDWTKRIERITESRAELGTGIIRYRYGGKEVVVVHSAIVADALRITVMRSPRSVRRSSSPLLWEEAPWAYHLGGA